VKPDRQKEMAIMLRRSEKYTARSGVDKREEDVGELGVECVSVGGLDPWEEVLNVMLQEAVS
jgi:hypothetical protein